MTFSFPATTLDEPPGVLRTKFGCTWFWSPSHMSIQEAFTILSIDRLAIATMVFKAERYVDIPTNDILSYIFDEPEYDQNKPVSTVYIQDVYDFLLDSTSTYYFN